MTHYFTVFKSYIRWMGSKFQNKCRSSWTIWLCELIHAAQGMNLSIILYSLRVGACWLDKIGILRWQTAGKREAQAPFLYFIDSASAASPLAAQPLNHTHSMLHPVAHTVKCAPECGCDWSLFCVAAFSESFYFCCDVQCAIRKHGWNGELHSKTWCIAFWTEIEFTTKWRYGRGKAENQPGTIKHHNVAPPYYQNDQ